MTTHTITLSAPTIAGRQSLPGLFGMLLKAHAIWRERRQLATLDDARLRDIGKSRAEARLEADRAAWDAPSRWLR